MSVLFSTFCLDCLEETLALDGGYIGTPDLSTETKGVYNPPHDYTDEANNFGLIYEGLKALKLLPRGVEEYKAFLEKHQGHRVMLLSDSENEPVELQGLEEVPEFKYSDNDFVDAYYHVHCKACDDVFQDPRGFKTSMRQFEPFIPTPQQLESFDKYAASGDIDMDYYRAGILDSEFIDSLSLFLHNHKNHLMEVRLSDEPRIESTQEVHLSDEPVTLSVEEEFRKPSIQPDALKTAINTENRFVHAYFIILLMAILAFKYLIYSSPSTPSDITGGKIGATLAHLLIWLGAYKICLSTQRKLGLCILAFCTLYFGVLKIPVYGWIGLGIMYVLYKITKPNKALQ